MTNKILFEANPLHAKEVAEETGAQMQSELYPRSVVKTERGLVFMLRKGQEKRLVVITDTPDTAYAGESAEFQMDGNTAYRKVGELTAQNATALRAELAWLRPQLLGLDNASAGMGDRLGLATPGHVRALQDLSETAQVPAPIFAQQSIREMVRTGRSPTQVMDDAMWGTFQAGWHGGFGADADHLKTPEDIDACAAVGYTFYTFDPGAFVNNAADTASALDLERMLADLPWAELDSSRGDTLDRYVAQKVDLETRDLVIQREPILRAAAKYGAAVAHVAKLYRHLASKGIPYEVEVSVDETETPTSHAEHFYIASEMKRLGIEWVSLAPRYVGRFEKGVDYIGDLDELHDDLKGHAALARALGPYKLSLHSGSDKFSVYPLIVEATRGRVHLKTAGTSYLEGLRAIARVDPALFRAIAELGVERYPTDRATYHVSAELERVPALGTLSDAALSTLLDQFDARQVLHVTFGSALARYGKEIHATLRAHETEHYRAIKLHFLKHLEPFSK